MLEELSGTYRTPVMLERAGSRIQEVDFVHRVTNRVTNDRVLIIPGRNQNERQWGWVWMESGFAWRESFSSHRLTSGVSGFLEDVPFPVLLLPGKCVCRGMLSRWHATCTHTCLGPQGKPGSEGNPRSDWQCSRGNHPPGESSTAPRLHCTSVPCQLA